MRLSFRDRSRPLGRLGIGVVAVAAAAGLATPTSPPTYVTPTAQTTPAAQVDAPIPALNWEDCGDLECATARVPLDYDDPDGETTRIFMAKHAATDTADKIGTLFVNPGGPGGPSSQVVQAFSQLLGPDVSAHFDVIGIDPRGVGGSTPVRCKSSRTAPHFPRNWVPLNAEQAKPLIRSNNYMGAACAENSNPILDHMTTADTARDMDLIRQAVGDDELTYYGISYGTYLGATYAAMFPDRVRAVVLDGVLDPVAWATGKPGFGHRLPFSTRLRSGVGAWDALVSAFNECDRVGKARCRFAGESGMKWRRITQRLKRGPATLPDGRIFYSDLVGGTLGALYSRGNYRFLMRQINRLYGELFGTPRPAQSKVDLVRSFRRLARSQPGPYSALSARSSPGSVSKGFAFSPSFEGVACADTINPSNPRAWIRAGAVADHQGPWFGRVWTWASGPCAQWPGSDDDAFRGPWRVHTAAPVLLVGNFHDPATPISGARRVNSLFARSRLLSLDTWGHGAIGESACVTTRMSRYLVSGTLPANGRVCQPDRQLFPRHHPRP